VAANMTTLFHNDYLNHKVFVYGSLRRFGALNFYLSDSQFLGDTKTGKEFTLFSLGPFPALVKTGDTAVIGELYEVSDATLAQLDRAEGHPDFYVRTRILLDDGSEVYAYLLPVVPTGCEVVQSGDWMEYLTS
jgi:gamma-glutamylaminecyclotransferase